MQPVPRGFLVWVMRCCRGGKRGWNSTVGWRCRADTERAVRNNPMSSPAQVLSGLPSSVWQVPIPRVHLSAQAPLHPHSACITPLPALRRSPRGPYQHHQALNDNAQPSWEPTIGGRGDSVAPGCGASFMMFGLFQPSSQSQGITKNKKV